MTCRCSSVLAGAHVRGFCVPQITRYRGAWPCFLEAYARIQFSEFQSKIATHTPNSITSYVTLAGRVGSCSSATPGSFLSLCILQIAFQKNLHFHISVLNSPQLTAWANLLWWWEDKGVVEADRWAQPASLRQRASPAAEGKTVPRAQEMVVVIPFPSP